MVTDVISDFINRLKNAAKAGHKLVFVPSSKLVAAISEVLQKEGYLKVISKKNKKGAKMLELALNADENGIARLREVERISKASRRLYSRVSSLRSVKGGYGRTIISTSKGIMSDVDARKQNVGGEPLFRVW